MEDIMNNRTDLACEKEQQLKVSDKFKNGVGGIEKEELFKGDLKITRISVRTDEAAQLLEKPVGNYVTISCERGFDCMPDRIIQIAEAVCCELKRISGGCKAPLVAGLGNEGITPDSLGVLVSKKIFATRHIRELAPELYSEKMSEVAVIATGVTGNTGLESAEIVKSLCDGISPDVVFAIDALACSDVRNLGKTIQITDTGISPGSGVNNARAELSEKTLGCRVIAVGVPTVVDMLTAVSQLSDAESLEDGYASMMVTPREIDRVAASSAAVISTALNMLFHPSISPSEIEGLVG